MLSGWAWQALHKTPCPNRAVTSTKGQIVGQLPAGTRASGRPAPERDLGHVHGNGAPLAVSIRSARLWHSLYLPVRKVTFAISEGEVSFYALV